MESLPERCPRCRGEVHVTRVQCSVCGEQIEGQFTRGRLVNMPEPHATLLEHFLRVRGNVRDMERELGLAYSTVRSRLDEAFKEIDRLLPHAAEEQQDAVLDDLQAGKITAAEAINRLRAIQAGGRHER